MQFGDSFVNGGRNSNESPTRIQWTIKRTGAELYLPMRAATSYLETPFIDGQKILKLK